MKAIRIGLKLNGKVALLGVLSVAVTAFALVWVAVWQSGVYNHLAQSEVDELIDADLDHLTKGVYNMVRTENEAVQQQIDYNLNVVTYLLNSAGGVSLAAETEDRQAVNQFSGQVVACRLPRFLVGGRRLGPNDDPTTPTPIVDEATRMVGETATIFQRLNEAGDMLRVATTVKNAAGRRAIDTFIPAVEPDGTPNPVIKAILAGQSYRGRAFVVDDWYLTAYAPLRDNRGNLVGMIYTGIRQTNIEARIRPAILETRVGKTGYVYVLGGKGERRGRYVVSHRGERDGENIWLIRDSDGRFVIQTIIGKATALPPGKLDTVRYRWQNPGEPAARWKIARLAYYEPWDWVIGTGVNEDELQTYRAFLEQGRTRMTNIMTLAGILISVLVGLAGVFVAWTVVRPIRRLTKAVETISRGDLDHRVNIASGDEIGTLASAFDAMAGTLKTTLDGLRQSEAYYRSLFDHAPEGIFRVTPDGRLVKGNPAMARMLAFPSAESMVESWVTSQAFYANPKDYDAQLADVMASDEPVERETLLVGNDRRQFWASINVGLVRDEAGRVLCLQGFVTDISERKRAEAERESLIQKLETANAEMERFTYTVSHDLKSPLITIKGFVGYLQQDCEAGKMEQLQADMLRINRATDTMHRLLDELLELSRIGRLVNPPVEAPWAELVKEALELVAGRLRERGVHVTVSPELPTVYGDRPRLLEVLQNLLDNAAKFMGDQPSPAVEVGVRGQAGETVIFVKDNGIGIDARYQQKVFGLFEKLASTAEGSGAGLAIVKRIVESHGGRIWVESEGLGTGCCFCFTVPGKPATP